MTLTTAEALDLSRLPPFRLVEVDYEQLRHEQMTGLVARLHEAGVAYDVQNMETDPLAVAVQEIAYRRMLDLRALNDAGKRLTLVYGDGAALDHIAATYYADLGLRRMVVREATANEQAVMESDDRFRRRIALAPEARSEVTPGAYVFKALSSDARIADAVALNYASGLVPVGEILVAVLPEPGHGEDVTEQLVEAARAAVLSPRIRLASAPVDVRAAAVVEASVTAALHLRPGPDAGLVLQEAQARLAAYLAERRRIGRVVSRSGMMGALHAGGVEWVDLQAPTTDIVPPPDGYVDMVEVAVTTEVSS